MSLWDILIYHFDPKLLSESSSAQGVPKGASGKDALDICLSTIEYYDRFLK